MQAYVFVNAKAGTIKAVTEGLRALKGVEAADACWGSPDIIMTVEVKDERALNDLILSKIQKLSSVEHTETHIVLE